MNIEEKTRGLIELLSSNGISNRYYNVVRSRTGFGNSNYIKFFSPADDFRPILELRISDHSIGQKRLFNEFSYEVEKMNNFSDIIRIVKSWI